MTHALCSLKPGDTMQISGPIDGPNIDFSPASPIKKLGCVTLGLLLVFVISSRSLGYFRRLTDDPILSRWLS